jgi:hypothetical protein
MARPIRDFCHIQQIKYIAHIFRLDNSELQKQILFDRRAPTTAWTRLEKILEMDVLQIRRTMMKRNELLRVVDHRFTHEHPKAT